MYLLLFISDSVFDTACVYPCDNHILKTLSFLKWSNYNSLGSQQF